MLHLLPHQYKDYTQQIIGATYENTEWWSIYEYAIQYVFSKGPILAITEQNVQMTSP